MSDVRNGPEKEMLLAVLEFRKEHNGTQYFSGFMGLNSLSASVKDGKIFLNLQKWPKNENTNKSSFAKEDDITF